MHPGAFNTLPRRNPSIPKGSNLAMTIVTKYGQQWHHQPGLLTELKSIRKV